MIPTCVIVEHILPFLDRATYDNCVIANKEVFHASQMVVPAPWPQTCLGVEQEILCAAFAPSGRAVACGCKGGDLYIWNKQQGRRHILKGHDLSVLSLVFSPNEELLASGSVDCTIRLWFLQDLLPTGESITLKGHERPVHSISFVPNSDTLASSAHEERIRLWDISKGECSMQQQIVPHPEKVESISVSPNGQYLASATWDGTVRLFELSDDVPRITKSLLELGKGLPLSKIQFSNDGRHIFGLKGFRIRRWNVQDGAGSLSFLSESGVHKVFSVAVSPDSDTVAYGDRDGTIRLAALSDGTNRATFKATLYGHHHQCSLAFSPDGRTLASGSADGALRLWNV
jgi:WD40 repeat protein